MGLTFQRFFLSSTDFVIETRGIEDGPQIIRIFSGRCYQLFYNQLKEVEEFMKNNIFGRSLIETKI